MPVSDADINLLRLLAARLERLSADSRWAHRASGVRGQLLRILDQWERGEPLDADVVKALTESAFRLLKLAAREVAR